MSYFLVKGKYRLVALNKALVKIFKLNCDILNGNEKIYVDQLALL
jgi:hypothetical protein